MPITSVPSIASIGEKDEWQVKVFRRTMSRGWEMYYDPEESSTITAAPRKGCVEIKKLRIRIHLCQNNKDNSNTINNTATTKEQNKKDSTDLDEKVSTAESCNTVVVRRLDTILLSTRKGGAVTLKFLDIGECCSFSDKLVYINSELILKPAAMPDFQNQFSMPQMNFETKRPYFQEKRDDNNTSTSSTDNSMRMSKYRKASHSIVDESNHSNNSNNDANLVEASQRRQDVLSYIVRLLHDPNFKNFVDDIEASLKGMPDCAKILSAAGENNNVKTDIAQGTEDRILAKAQH